MALKVATTLAVPNWEVERRDSEAEKETRMALDALADADLLVEGGNSGGVDEKEEEELDLLEIGKLERAEGPIVLNGIEVSLRVTLGDAKGKLWNVLCEELALRNGGLGV